MQVFCQWFVVGWLTFQFIRWVCSDFVRAEEDGRAAGLICFASSCLVISVLGAALYGAGAFSEILR